MAQICVSKRLGERIHIETSMNGSILRIKSPDDEIVIEELNWSDWEEILGEAQKYIEKMNI